MGVADPAQHDRLAKRAQIAASGRYAVRNGASLAATFTKDDWADALDLPRDAVTAATLTGPAQAATISQGGLGIIKPIRGNSFVTLSTGVAEAKEPDGPEPGTDFEPLNSVAGDSITLTLDLHVPEGADRMSLQYNFLSSESPDFIGSAFNDTFSVRLVDRDGPRDFLLASVNSSQFFAVSNTRGKNSGFDIFTDNPSGVDDNFGQGLPDAGLTDFQAFDVEVASGSDLTLVLTITDNGDGILDSEVLIDAVQFSAIETVDPNPSLLLEGSLTADLDRLATEGRHVRGAVADGVTELVLRIKVPAPGSATFSIGGDKPAADGELRTLAADAVGPSVPVPSIAAAGGEYAIVVYRAPDDFAREGGGDDHLAERPIHIAASFTLQGGEAVAFTSAIDLQLRRPPVVFAHGLWSTDLQWLPLAIATDAAFTISFAGRPYACVDELRVDPQGKDFLVCPLKLAPATEGIPKCLTDHRETIGPATREALGNARRLGLAASQVDVVAHGLGGIHARKYINSTEYSDPQNPERDNVNRLITINTPHFGTPIADTIVAARGNPDDSQITQAQLLCTARVIAEAPIESDTIDELSVASSTLAATPVPSHAVIGIGGRTVISAPGGPQAATFKIAKVAHLYNAVEKKQFPPPPPPAPQVPKKILTKTSPVFGTQDHDLFVSVASQQGGLVASATTPLQITNVVPPANGQFYSDSDFFSAMKEPRVSNAVTSLLNSRIADTVGGDPQKPLFGHFAASPNPLAPAGARSTPPTRLTEHSLAAESHTLRIVSPTTGTQVIAGGTITVEVVAENGFVPRSVSVMTGGSLASSETAPFMLTIGIPPESLGPIRLSAIGFGEDQEEEADGEVVLSNDVVLLASTTATIVSVAIINQDPILFGAGTRRPLTVVGRYNDDVTRDITSRSTGTLYRSSNPAVVTVDSDGTLVATGSGIATVVALNGGVQDSITVTVKTNKSPQAVASGDVSLTCVAPGAEVPVQLDGSASFDPDGDPLAFSWSEGGIVLASGPTPVVELGAGTHTIDLQVSDGIGGSAHATVTVSIEEDSAPPSVTIVGSNPRTVECAASYSDEGATAHDACDGDVTAAIVTQSHVNTGEPGSYSVDYQVHDQAGLTTTATRAVSVQDTQPPVLTVVGGNPGTAECGTSYSDEGATAIDACDGPLTAAVVTQSHVDIAVPGNYAVDYQVHDDTGLTTTAVRAVSVQDTQPPVLTVAGGNPRTTECGFPYSDEGATATDVCDGSLTTAIVAQSHVNPGMPGSYTVDYQVHDQTGLTATATRAVSVQDTLAPVLTITGSNPGTAECAMPYIDPGATAVDVCDGNLTAAIVSRSHVNPGVPGNYTVDYEVHDQAGATAKAIRSVTIVDRTPPQVSVKPMRQLFPPNFHYRRFELSDCAAVTDTCSRADIDRHGAIVAIHSDERDVEHRFDPDDDIVILGHSSFKLRQQSNHRNGRVYEIEFTVRDRRGNRSAVHSCFIGVKHSRHSPTPIDDGRIFTVRP